MDETGLQLEHKPRRVLGQKGVRYLCMHARTNGKRETITLIACISAAGNKIRPRLIAKSKASRVPHSYDVQSAREGSTWSVSSTGWTKQGIAHLWFEKSFLPNIVAERPQILITTQCLYGTVKYSTIPVTCGLGEVQDMSAVGLLKLCSCTQKR